MFSNVFTLPGQSRSEAKYASFIVSDEFFVKANGIQMLSGRDFRDDDSAKILSMKPLSEKWVSIRKMHPDYDLTDAQSRVWEIAGVMKDFNFGSLHKDVESFMVWINHKQDGLWANLTVHTATSNYTELLSEN